jgi:uncharacterized protein with ACT and thioredoxin-like domain
MSELKEISWVLSEEYISNKYFMRYIKKKSKEGVKYIELDNFNLSTTEPFLITLRSDENWSLRCKSHEALTKMYKRELSDLCDYVNRNIIWVKKVK